MGVTQLDRGGGSVSLAGCAWTWTAPQAPTRPSTPASRSTPRPYPCRRAAPRPRRHRLGRAGGVVRSGSRVSVAPLLRDATSGAARRRRCAWSAALGSDRGLVGCTETCCIARAWELNFCASIHVPDVGQFWHEFGQFGAESAHFRSVSSFCGNLPRSRLDLRQIWGIIGANLTNLGRSRPIPVRSRPTRKFESAASEVRECRSGPAGNLPHISAGTLGLSLDQSSLTEPIAASLRLDRGRRSGAAQNQERGSSRISRRIGRSGAGLDEE